MSPSNGRYNKIRCHTTSTISCLAPDTLSSWSPGHLINRIERHCDFWFKAAIIPLGVSMFERGMPSSNILTVWYHYHLVVAMQLLVRYDATSVKFFTADPKRKAKEDWIFKIKFYFFEILDTNWKSRLRRSYKLDRINERGCTCWAKKKSQSIIPAGPSLV